LLDDPAPVQAAAARLAGRRVLRVGTGTSWHCANHGAWFLRAAGVEAWPVQAADAALYGLAPGAGDALVLLSHRGTKLHTTGVVERAREAGVPSVQVSGIGSPGADIETVEQETSSAFTASHLGAMLRLAQLAGALGADLGDLRAVPGAVEAVLHECETPPPPARLLEFIGDGPNQWTAAEGALKVRETARVAAEGLSAEQFLHGPSVALREGDRLVCLEGGGPGAGRLAEIAAAVARGVTVHRYSHTGLGEPLSVFPLTVVVQRIALETAEALGGNPDSFGRDEPDRAGVMESIDL
ncbi:MAG: SIS domain-containing protein, partial [Gaiellales bacterium]